MRTTQKLIKNGRVGRDDVAAVGERFHHRGRGAVSNQAGRFEPETRAACDDGWDTIEEDLPSLRTTLTKEMFLNHLYGGMDEPELKIIDVFICKLRKKLSTATDGENHIETVWGRGYVLRDPEPAADDTQPIAVGA